MGEKSFWEGLETHAKLLAEIGGRLLQLERVLADSHERRLKVVEAACSSGNNPPAFRDLERRYSTLRTDLSALDRMVAGIATRTDACVMRVNELDGEVGRLRVLTDYVARVKVAWAVLRGRHAG